MDSPEYLSNQSFSAISHTDVAQLPGRDDPEPVRRMPAGRDEQREVPAANALRRVEDLLELRCAAESPSFERPGRHGQRELTWVATHVRRGQQARYDDETVRRLRPLARRRFKTRRPFFVLMRTRKPWVRAAALAVRLERTLHDLKSPATDQ